MTLQFWAQEWCGKPELPVPRRDSRPVPPKQGPDLLHKAASAPIILRNESLACSIGSTAAQAHFDPSEIPRTQKTPKQWVLAVKQREGTSSCPDLWSVD